MLITVQGNQNTVHDHRLLKVQEKWLNLGDIMLQLVYAPLHLINRYVFCLTIP